uniref:Putative secreted protein n=1 Tax=Anopheles triannulatus TaxID=58253 RepID=A0A2M4B6I6_9DIPT
MRRAARAAALSISGWTGLAKQEKKPFVFHHAWLVCTTGQQLIEDYLKNRSRVLRAERESKEFECREGDGSAGSIHCTCSVLA